MKIKKDQIEEHSKLTSRLRDASEVVHEAIEAYNTAAANEWDKVKDALAKYNETVADADGFRDSVASAARDFFDGKSERWQEGEKGQAAAEFADTWEVEMSEAELDDPEPVDAPDFAEIDAFEQLPMEPS